MTQERKERPAPGATGHGPNTASRVDPTDGAAAKQLAFDLFREHRAELVRDGCRRFVEVLRRQGQGTINDLRAAMAIPQDLDPRWLGTVPNTLARHGIIRAVGYVKSDRAHDRPITVWELQREPRPGELDEGPAPASAEPRPSRLGDGAAVPERPGAAPPQAADPAKGPATLFRDLGPMYRDPGDDALRPDGRRRRR